MANCHACWYYKSNKTHKKAGTVAKWSRALIQSHSEWTVQSLNPGEGCYGDGELSGSRIALFLHMAINNNEPSKGKPRTRASPEATQQGCTKCGGTSPFSRSWHRKKFNYMKCFCCFQSVDRYAVTSQIVRAKKITETCRNC